MIAFIYVGFFPLLSWFNWPQLALGPFLCVAPGAEPRCLRGGLVEAQKKGPVKAPLKCDVL